MLDHVTQFFRIQNHTHTPNKQTVFYLPLGPPWDPLTSTHKRRSTVLAPGAPRSLSVCDLSGAGEFAQGWSPPFPDNLKYLYLATGRSFCLPLITGQLNYCLFFSLCVCTYFPRELPVFAHFFKII